MTSIPCAMLGSGPLVLLLVAGCGGEAPAPALTDAFFEPSAVSAPAVEQGAGVEAIAAGLSEDLAVARASGAAVSGDTPLFGMEMASLSAAAIGEAPLAERP
jgi:hypothetical protein